MRILVAGATGAIGRQLLPLLLERGHEVVGLARTPERAAAVARLGAEPVVGDALDAEAVGRAVAQAAPEVIVHQLTALSGGLDLRHFDRTFAATTRLRVEATDHLLAAARAAGATRIVAQGYAGWPFGRTGPAVRPGDAPLDTDPVASMRGTLAGLRHLEEAVLGADGLEGVVLRYGALYGPGTSMEPGGESVEALRKRQFPLVGGGGGVWSFVHVADAAEATVAAVERGQPGVSSVVDDEPAAVRDWLPVAARAVGARPPIPVPRWVGRLVAGEALTVMMTEVRGASNQKARSELGWTPRHSSWRTGFDEALAR